MSDAQFVGGLLNGFMSQDRYLDERDRRQKLDALAERDSNTRNALMQGQADDAALERTDRQGLRKALAGDDTATDTSTNATDAQSTAPSDGAMPTAPAAPSAGTAPGSRNSVSTGADGSQTTSTPLNAFQAPTAGLRVVGGIKGSGDPILDNMNRTAAYYSKIDPAKAADIATKAETYKQAKYEAGRNAIYKGGLEQIGSGGPQGLVDYYKHYNDGFDAQYIPDGKGGGLIKRTDAQGKDGGSIKFRDSNDLALQFRDMIYPDKAAENYAAVRTKAAEEGNKVHILAPGGSAVRGDGVVVGTNTNDPNSLATKKWMAENGYLRTPGAGNGTGKGGKDLGEFSDIDRDFKEMTEGSAVKFNDVDTYNQAKDLARSIWKNNMDNGKPTVPTARAITAALAIQKNPALEVPQVDMDTGNINLVYKDSRGGDVVTRQNYASPQNLKDIKPEQVKSIVANMAQTLPKQEFETLRDVAFDNTGNAARNYLESQKPGLYKQLESNPLYKDATQSQLDKIVDEHIQKVMAPSLQRKASWLSLYDTERAKENGQRLTFNGGVRNPITAKPVTGGTYGAPDFNTTFDADPSTGVKLP